MYNKLITIETIMTITIELIKTNDIIITIATLISLPLEAMAVGGRWPVATVRRVS